MTLEYAIDILRQTILISLTLVSPLLGAAIVIGLTVSVIQTVTSIQEQTLTFVPKLVGVGLALVIASHWLVRTLMEFTAGSIMRIAELAP